MEFCRGLARMLLEFHWGFVEVLLRFSRSFHRVSWRFRWGFAGVSLVVVGLCWWIDIEIGLFQVFVESSQVGQ